MGDLQNLLWLLIHAGMKMEHYLGENPNQLYFFGIMESTKHEKNANS